MNMVRMKMTKIRQTRTIGHGHIQEDSDQDQNVNVATIRKTIVN